MFTKTNFRIIAGVFASAFFIAASTQPVLAATAAYEPFDYSSSLPNGTASTAAGFTGSWTCGTTPTIATGLTYTDLPTANNSLSSTGGRQSVSLSDSLSSGTKWISFLFNQTGNNGGNICGVYLPNGSTGLFFGYGLSPFSATQGRLGLGFHGHHELQSSGGGVSGKFLSWHLRHDPLSGRAMKIDFDTSGLNDTITVYLNPTADATSPGVAATYTVTTFDVGTISGIGFQNAGGGNAILVDEIRVGDSYADVVSDDGVVTPPSPVITDVSPSSGLTDGGTVVTITGSNFLAGATVQFGPNPGTAVSLTSSNSISATTPAGAPGAVNVVIANTNGLSATRFGGFTYELPPLPPPVLVPGSVTLTGSNMNFEWLGATNTTSVLLTSTNLEFNTIWIPAETNVFGADGLSSNSVRVNTGDPQRFYTMSEPTAIVVVEAPTGLQTIPSGSTNAIGLAWTASPTESVIGYRILYGLDSQSLTNTVDVGNVTSAIIFGLVPGQTYTLAVVALADGGQSPEDGAVITAQTDTTVSIIDLFNASTPLEPPTTVDTPNALYTYVADRVRDRHARESQFQLYDHYLSWYWEQRIARIEIIDTVGRNGGTTVTFNYTTLARLNPAEFRAFYLGQNTVADYHFNVIADLESTSPSAIPGETDYNYTATVSSYIPGGRPLQVGDRMEIEISQFLLAPRNGRPNYYGTAILYIVGQGIVPWEGVGGNLDSYPLSTNAWLGGQTTVHYQYSNEPQHLFKQMAGNIAPTNGQPFMLGRRLHHTDFGNGVHSEPNNPVFSEQIGKLGPGFIARSCVECHVNNGRALPPAIGEDMFQTVMKVGDDSGGTPHPTLGSVLQPQNTSGPAEGSATIANYTLTNGQYGDGTPYELRDPIYSFNGTTPSNYSARLAPPLVGMGLLEAISESSVMALADPADADQNGISGRAQMVTDPETGQARLGRFGYKGARARVSHQVAGALNTDMGVTTPVFPILDGETTGGTPEISAADLDLMTRYVALLGLQARRDLADTQALQGEVLFASASCIDCHTPEFTTSPYHPMSELSSQTIHPYSDLLLHDMGPGLADNMGEGVATGSEWRTAPLWNIGHTAGVNESGEAYLHDGRARTLEEAILWHGGEAEASKEAFRTMPAADRAALIKFLESL